MNATENRRPNRLAQATSPYLLQHAHNPVDWYPWGEEALRRAHDEDKPILLSIGYSACHWCHVMERESFENVLALDSLNQEAKKGLLAAAEARRRARLVRKIDPEKIPVLSVTTSALSTQKFDSQEGFVLSRINGEWDVRSILKLCPLPEEDILLIFARLLDRKVITLR
jgi:hypothetical protein